MQTELMQLEIIHRTVPRYKMIRQYGNQAGAKTPTGDIFLYVGKNRGLVHRLSSVFDFGYNTEDISTAIMAIEKMQEQNKSIIHVIILDLPFNRNELEQLLSTLHEAGSSFASVPVFYHIKQLLEEDKKVLHCTKLVDEVLDLDINLPDLPEKAGFFRKTREAMLKATGKKQLNKKSILFRRLSLFAKRTFDLVVGSLLLVFTLPVFLLIAICIKLTSKGPVFYNEYRAGRGYDIFRFYKFRTLRVGADRLSSSLQQIRKGQRLENFNRYVLPDEPWLTGIGVFLKKTRLDELPQLFNVLKGDMSMVGNKPLPLHEATRLTTDEWAERFAAPVGVTGFWKICRKSQPAVSIDESLEMDINYARKYGLLMDFRIIWKSSRLFF